ncbi:MAG: hypothetical protein NC416_16785, partial [Eubacterium sp.]|nr:hypothetical protein [Eubacterium sp.]
MKNLCVFFVCKGVENEEGAHSQSLLYVGLDESSLFRCCLKVSTSVDSLSEGCSIGQNCSEFLSL